jgi:hypothetical protein
MNKHTVGIAGHHGRTPKPLVGVRAIAKAAGLDHRQV